MTLDLKHFDPRLNQWIYTDDRQAILTEKLSNTLLEFYFPDKAEKGQSQQEQMSISQLLASFPQGIKDFAEELEVQAQRLASIQDDPRIVAAYYCERYEKRKELLSQNKLKTGEVNNQETDIKNLGTNDDLDADHELDDDPAKDDLFMYKLIKADLLGHQQLLETEKVKQELSRFVQSEWRDIAIGKTLTFDRGMIISSKELKNGEICVPWLKLGEKVLNFRSPFLNSNGLCVSTNKHVEDRVAPDSKSLQGIIVVNDEDHKRIQQRITELEARGIDVDFIDPAETESERQARDTVSQQSVTDYNLKPGFYSKFDNRAFSRS